MRVRVGIWTPGLFSVLALVLAACGGSDTTATPSLLPTAAISPTAKPLPTATISPTVTAVAQPEAPALNVEEEEYLGAVTDAQLLTVKVFMGFGEIFFRTYPVREALLTALLEGGVGTPFIENLVAVQTLDPPDRFREDHWIWLEATTENLRIDTEAAQAIRDGDLVRFAHLNGQLAETGVRGRLALSPVFCQIVAFDPREAAICALEGPSLTGEYEVGLNNLLREFSPDFSSRQSTVAFRLSLTPKEMGRSCQKWLPAPETLSRLSIPRWPQ